MEKKADTKRKSPPSDEPPDKKSRSSLVLEDILPPSEERNKDLSTHSIQHVASSDDAMGEHVPENAETPQADLINGSTEQSRDQSKEGSKEIITDKEPKSPEGTSTPPDNEPLPPGPSSSVEEVVGIRSPHKPHTDGDNDQESANESEKNIKWKVNNQSHDQRPQPTSPDLLNPPPANTTDPQSSTAPFPLRDKCTYGSKCYRKSAEHKAKFSHPGDSDFGTTDDRPECPYGIKCYRKNHKHRNDFKHTIRRSLRAQTPGHARTYNVDESGSDSSLEESVDESEFEDLFDDSSDDAESDW